MKIKKKDVEIKYILEGKEGRFSLKINMREGSTLLSILDVPHEKGIQWDSNSLI